MKKYTLASLALFVAPAALAEPGLNETLAYINARCDAFSYMSGGGTTYRTGSISLEGSQLAYTRENRYESDGYEKHETITGRLDLRRVEIKLIPEVPVDHGVIPAGASLYCGDKCILEEIRTVTNAYGKTKTETREDRPGAAVFHCRVADRVTRAFERLQELAGGAVADPFAN